MASDQLALVMIAGIWAALNTLVSAMRVVNDKRDVIVTGVFNEQKLSLEHRKLMFQNDWIPLKFGVALTSLLFAFVLYAVPSLAANADTAIIRVAYLAALGPLLSFLLIAGLGWRDYQFIRRTLNTTRKKE